MANQFKPFPLTDDELRDLCLNQKMSQNAIAKKYGIGQSSVSRHLRAIGLGGARNFDDRSGENNSNWKGVSNTPCDNCGKPIGKAIADRGVGERNYCSRKCYHARRTQESMAFAVCKTCAKSFTYNTHKERDRRYCSIACACNSEENKERTSRVHRGKTIPEWHRQAVSKAQSSISDESRFTYGRNGHHDSPKAGNIFYRSSYERIAYELLDNDATVTNYQPEPFTIRYINANGNVRRYRPDVLVRKGEQTLLVEIKPEWQIDNPKNILKFEAGKQYAARKGWVFEVWTEKELGI